MARRPLRSALLVVAAVIAMGALASLDPGSAGQPANDTRAVTPASNTPPPQSPGGGTLNGLPELPFTQYAVAVAVVALAVAFVYLFVRTDAVVSATSTAAAAVAGALATLLSWRDTAPGDTVESGDDGADLEAVGRAAGAAADRIEAEAAVTNEVYRAWYEMTRHLDVRNPETTAPDEFEARAVERGMAPDDVARLTRLFEEVRYGERDPDSREERAVAALRRIETAYGDGVDR